MIHATTDKLVLEPVAEQASIFVHVPESQSRWGNGKLSISGKVLAVGPDVVDVEVGEYAYHSDSCYAPICEGKYNVIRQGSIMFTTSVSIPVGWVGSEESYD